MKRINPKLSHIANALSSSRLNCLLAAVLVSVWSGFPAFAAQPGDVISNYRSVMVLTKDASLLVHETITVSFAANQHHGIVREIPSTARISDKNKRMSCYIHTGEMKCDGSTVQSNVSLDNGKYLIKLGDPNRLLTGTHEYSIEYTAYGAVRLANDKPELYWNIVGTDWKMPIKKAEGFLMLPEGISIKTVPAACFVGERGSKQKGSIAHKSKEIEFTASNLAPGQGLTMAVQMPPDSVKIPGLISQWLWDLEQAGLLIAAGTAFLIGLGPLGLLLLLWFAWRALTVQDANWDSSGGSSLDCGSSGDGFGGGGGDAW